jgi:hypothetical protein
MEKDKRLFLPAFAELVDRLAVDQIKEVMLPEISTAIADEMEKISHDIDMLIEERDLRLTSRFVRIVIAISQLNLHIWHLKEKMNSDPERYKEYLKLAHQLNGVRNHLKNQLLEEAKDKEKSDLRTNVGTDGLEGWTISIK